ncbi:50S ribosomal protein L6 [Alphaproteobacteria bacterium SO-S41]|nr:50S ribosomal protein L6 [Alphaproteobacteria bacterium SO-S41]
MSRIGKLPIPLPKGVTATVAGREVKVKGPKGELKLTLVEEISASEVGGQLEVKPRDDSTRSKAMWGMSRTLIGNMVHGVSTGFDEKLEISGVGYKAAVQGRNLQLQLGYSHDIIFPIPTGIDIKAEKPTSLTISGVDKQQVGAVAAKIRSFRGPEPYKGKGVRYATETIRRKEGKKK